MEGKGLLNIQPSLTSKTLTLNQRYESVHKTTDLQCLYLHNGVFTTGSDNAKALWVLV